MQIFHFYNQHRLNSITKVRIVHWAQQNKNQMRLNLIDCNKLWKRDDGGQGIDEMYHHDHIKMIAKALLAICF